MKKRAVPGLATTFTRPEVEAVLQLLTAAVSGRDVKVIARAPALLNAAAKFRRLKTKADCAGEET